jgi:hypothetical protein
MAEIQGFSPPLDKTNMFFLRYLLPLYYPDVTVGSISVFTSTVTIL